jgi:ATP-dependent Clp protease ATP-binding subunit ClpA
MTPLSSRTKKDMTNLGVYQERFDESGLRVFEYAVAESRRRKQNHVSLGHVLLAMAAEDGGTFKHHLKKMRAALQLEPESVAVEVRLDKILEYSPKYDGRGVRIGPDTIGFFRRAMKVARSNGREKIASADLLSTVLQLAPILYAGPKQPGAR